MEQHLTVEAQRQAQVGKRPREPGLPSSAAVVAAEGVRPGQLALEEMMLQLAEQQQPDC